MQRISDKQKRGTILHILRSWPKLNVGLKEHSLWSEESLTRLELLDTVSFDLILAEIKKYERFFLHVGRENLHINSEYRKILQIACANFGLFTDFDLLPGDLPADCVLHAYATSGNCVFFSPNFIEKIQYDFLTLVSEPWFHLFSRQHNRDLDAFLIATEKFLTQSRREPFDISAIPANVLQLEKIPGKPLVTSIGYVYSPLFDQSGAFVATLVVSDHQPQEVRKGA